MEYLENSELTMMRLFVLMTMIDDEYHEEEKKMVHDLWNGNILFHRNNLII